MSLPETVVSLLTYALAQAGTLTGFPAGAVELFAVATSTVAALLVAAAVARLHATPVQHPTTRGPAAPVRWRERSHQLRVPRTCDPDAPGRRRPRAPSALAPAA